STYDSLLDDLLKKRYPSSSDSGLITLDLSSLYKRDTSSYFKSLNFYSVDNFSKVSAIKENFDSALTNEKLGDALYLYNYVACNGKDELLALDSTSEFSKEVCKFLKVSNLNKSILKFSSTNVMLEQYYSDLSC
ncbi:uncharacterized protein RJT21DRAFT_82008, partial [Scheffersomyces amazonensis]|uniref:uncharacterized protein n=1 Tax=Scheffersomyces amazonensis TaxID=1078765 RepID=UPI00315D6562